MTSPKPRKAGRAGKRPSPIIGGEEKPPSSRRKRGKAGESEEAVARIAPPPSIESEGEEQARSDAPLIDFDAPILSAGERRDLSPRSRAACSFIEKYCRSRDGFRLKLAPYQLDVLKAYYRGEVGGPRLVTRLILSCARKQGKSALAAATLLYDMAGAGHAIRNSLHFTAAAGSKEQAFLIFDHAAHMVLSEPRLASRFRVVEGARRMAHVDIGSHLESLPTSARSVQGREAFSFAFDEISQAKSLTLWNALDHSQTKTEGGRGAAICTSTMSNHSGNPLSDLIEMVLAARRGGDPMPHWFLAIYAGDIYAKDRDPYGDKNLRLANPGLHADPPLLSWDVLIKNRIEALASPSLLQFFIAYKLNAESSNKSPLLKIGDWRSLALSPSEVKEMEGKVKGERCYIGLDLSRSIDLSGIALYFPRLGYLTAMAWLPKETIEDSERQDKVPYRRWEAMGALRLCEGNTIDYEEIADYIIEALETYDVREVRYDPAYFNMIKMAMRAKGWELDEDNMKAVFKPHRQGYLTMTGSIADFERLIFEKRLKHCDSPVLNNHVTGCSVETGKVGGGEVRRPVKPASFARIDLAVASIMACSGDISAEAKPASAPVSPFYERLRERSRGA